MSQLVLKVYQGFSSPYKTCVLGHVLKSDFPTREKPTRNPFKNALLMIKRYRINPSKYQAVRLALGDSIYRTKTDRRGFFQFVINTPQVKKTLEYIVDIEDESRINHKGRLVVHDPDLVVISDVDDTVLVSYATKKWRKLYLLLTKNVQSRKPFRGINELYRNISNGRSSTYFYVSSSEWNLYDFLKEFMAHHHLPAGVFLLQDIKSGILDLLKSGGGTHEHKTEKVALLLEVFEKSNFILIGDSGQKDPEIYLDIVKQYSSRIEQVYIRDVRKSRRTKIRQIKEEMSLMGVEMSFVSNMH